jgi:hypothetical protein
MGVTRRPLGIDSHRKIGSLSEEIRELKILIASRKNYQSHLDNGGLELKLEALLRQQTEKK